MPGPRFASLAKRYGPVALIAGASEGIGAAFAWELAGSGFDVVLVARRAERLEELAASIRSAHPVGVRTVACDLEQAAAADAIEHACRDQEVGLLVYNAAASVVGRFLELPIATHVRSVHVNALGLVRLAHAFGRPMAARGRGGIVVMSSLTAFQGTPLVASYGATKAFDLALAEGLWGELEESGIDVLACCPGATSTPGYERATPRRTPTPHTPKPQTAAEVAREALAALGHRPVVITGRGNRLVSFVMRRLFSRRLAIATIGREMRRRYG
jgi:short-subunit dehydrogenase